MCEHPSSDQLLLLLMHSSSSLGTAEFLRSPPVLLSCTQSETCSRNLSRALWHNTHCHFRDKANNRIYPDGFFICPAIFRCFASDRVCVI